MRVRAGIVALVVPVLSSGVLVDADGATDATASDSGFAVVVTGGLNGMATATWTEPSDPGTGVTRYVVTSDSGTAPGNLSPDARSGTVTGMDSRYTRTVWVGWTDDNGDGGSQVRYIRPTLTQLRISNTRPPRGSVATYIGEIRGQIPGMPIALQRRYPGTSTWTSVLGGHSNSVGQVVWRFHQYRTAYYRAVSLGSPGYYGSISYVRGVVVR